MGYEIVYNRQFLKIDDKIIPLVLYGSNNAYEIMWNGKERRERSWNPMYLGSNKIIAMTENELMEFIEGCCGDTCQNHFMRNSKLVDDKGLISFFKNGIKNAKTIEEMNENYYFSGMQGYFSVWRGMNNTIENKVEINSSEDLRKYLSEIQKRLDNKTNNENIYFCLRYYDEEFKSRVPKERKPKERLTDYYAIKVNGYNYLLQLTKTRIKYCSLCNKTKQFKTEKEANKYIEKIKDRFTANFEVEHIVE